MPAISFLPFLQTVPPATRILTALTVLFTVAALFLSQLAAQNSPVEGIASLHIPWLVMVPGTSWRYPWVLVTAGFVELSVVEVSKVSVWVSASASASVPFRDCSMHRYRVCWSEV